jgi:hypothetical protein
MKSSYLIQDLISEGHVSTRGGYLVDVQDAKRFSSYEDAEKMIKNIINDWHKGKAKRKKNEYEDDQDTSLFRIFNIIKIFEA